MKTKSSNEVSHSADVSSNVQKTNSLQSKSPTETTITQYQAQQRVAGRSTSVRIQQSVVSTSAKKRPATSDDEDGNSGASSTPGFHGYKRIRAEEGGPEEVSHFIAGEGEEASVEYLAEHSVEKMRDRLQTINAESSPEERIIELAEILIKAPAAVQRQVVENLVMALEPETGEETGGVLSDEVLDLLNSHLKQAPTLEFANNDSTESIIRISQGILDGVAAKPDLDLETAAQLLDVVSTWCSDPAKVPDKDLAAVHGKAVSILQTRQTEFHDSLECIETICYARALNAALAGVPDENLPEVTKKLRFCAKWFFDEASPGHRLNEMFTRLIDRIDERQPSIGAIPEIAHVVWVGNPVSEKSIENLVSFLRHNKNYELMIGTDRPQETQLVIDRVSEQNPEAARLLAKVTPCHYKEWLPADDERIGNISGADIRTLVETLRSGPGKVYPGASDILRLLGLRSEKIVNGERKRGGLYFDVDLMWHKALPPLSSPLGIMLNARSGGVNNNVLGVPTDTEVVDILIEDIVDAYRERNLETALERIEEIAPDVAETINKMNSEYEQTHTENTLLEPTGNDPMYEFNKATTGEEKREIREQNLKRAREIMAQFHPAENKLDYSRFQYATDDSGKNSRFALTMDLTGPGRLDYFLQIMFGKDYVTNERFSRLGTLGGAHPDPVRPDQVYTEISEADWARTAPGRRASIGGTTTLGELENPPTGPLRSLGPAQQ